MHYVHDLFSEMALKSPQTKVKVVLSAHLLPPLPLTPAWPRSCPELDKEAAVVGLHQLQLAQLGGHQQTMERTISRSAHTIKVGTAAQLHSCSS